MNIWVIQTGEPLPHIDKGQREFRCSMLSRQLSQQGHSTVRWANSFDHYTKTFRNIHKTNIRTPGGYSIQFIPGNGYRKNISFRRITHYKMEASSFKRIAANLHIPDIVFVCMPSITLANAVSDFCLKRDIPYILDIRDLWPDLYYNVFPKITHKLIDLLTYRDRQNLRRTIRGAVGLTAISQSYLDWTDQWARNGKQTPKSVIPMSFPDPTQHCPSKTDPAAISFLKKHHIPKNSFIATFVGTFVSSYSLETVIDAAKSLQKENHTGIHIILAGNGTHATQLKDQASECSNIHFPGWLNGDEIRSLMSVTDIGLTPYSSTALMSLPNKPFEYLAYGKPFLNSLSGELTEIVEVNGVGTNFDPTSPAELKDAILKYYNSPEILAIESDNARRLYESKYSSELTYRNAVNFIKEVLKEHTANSK